MRKDKTIRIAALSCFLLAGLLAAPTYSYAQKTKTKGKFRGKTEARTNRRTKVNEFEALRTAQERGARRNAYLQEKADLAERRSRIEKREELDTERTQTRFTDKQTENVGERLTARMATQYQLSTPRRVLGTARLPDAIHTNDIIANVLKNRNYYGPTIKAVKIAEVKATQVTAETTVSTILANGVKEVDARKAKPGDWIVERLDPKTGKTQEAYVVFASDFANLYKPVKGKDGIYATAGEVREFVYVRKYSPTDLTVDYWGGYEQHFKGDFYLNITEIGEGKENVDTYGVAPEEFRKTHKVLASFPDAIHTNDLITQLLQDRHYYGPSIKAVKVSEVRAKQVEAGTTISTILANGVKEVDAREAKVGDWIVERFDPKTGETKEAYVVFDSDFTKLYKPVEGKEGVYKTADGVREFVYIDKSTPTDLTVDYWGGYGQHFEDGFYLNITEIGEGKENVDTYGVAAKEFHATHEIIAE